MYITYEPHNNATGTIWGKGLSKRASRKQAKYQMKLFYEYYNPMLVTVEVEDKEDYRYFEDNMSRSKFIVINGKAQRSEPKKKNKKLKSLEIPVSRLSKIE